MMRRRAAAILASALLAALGGCAGTVLPADAARAEGGPRTVVARGVGPAPSPPRDGTDADGWRVVWHDGFDGTAPDPARWGFDVDCWGGGNNERQCYTDRPENARVEGGLLTITARREPWRGPALPPHLARAAPDPAATAARDYTSARLTTRGRASWTYGRIVVRAKLPGGQGSWPAIWMLPEGEAYGTWAASGEIDILEAVNLGTPCATCPSGRDERILGTLHFGGRWPANRFASTTVHASGVTDGFHDFGLVWTPDRFIWTLDGVPFATKARGDWWTGDPAPPPAARGTAPFDRPFHLILNLAVGGGLSEVGLDAAGNGPKPGDQPTRGVDPAAYPQSLVIDQVTVWQCARPDHACPATPDTRSPG